jgi:two-component system, NarL family, sensor kinase
MPARTAWLLLGLAPLLATSAGVAWVVSQRAQVLSEMHLQAIRPVLMAAREAELQGKLNLGRSAIQHLVRDGMPNPEAQQQALVILRRLEFGHDGFFFVFDFSGKLLLQPREPGLEGRDLLSAEAVERRMPVQRLLAQAQSGGGYVTFSQRRPSNGRLEDKLAYVEPIAGWEWMLGTGAFVDDTESARLRIEKATEAAIGDTLARIAAVAMLGALLVAGFALALNYSEQRKADAKLRAMAAQLLRGQEAERARVARELHDGVTQSLVSVKFLFESALARARTAQVEAPISKELEACLTRLREILGEVRLIAHDLRPPLLDDLGLAEALSQFAREWQTRSGVQVELALQAPTGLPEAGATALFRFAQEALGNVERHAEANTVQLSLQELPQGVRLRIADDGKGFDVDGVQRSARHGLGLTHLRERVEMLGGRFVLRSSASGTVLEAWLPRTTL